MSAAVQLNEARAKIDRCGPDEGAYAPVRSIVACYNYLSKLGNQQCVSGRNLEKGVNYCGTAGSGGKVVGYSLIGRPTSSKWYVSHLLPRPLIENTQC